MLLVGSQEKCWISTVNSKGTSNFIVSLSEFQRTMGEPQSTMWLRLLSYFQINCTLEPVSLFASLVACILSDALENNSQLRRTT